jgi:hypothetical protein
VDQRRLLPLAALIDEINATQSVSRFHTRAEPARNPFFNNNN